MDCFDPISRIAGFQLWVDLITNAIGAPLKLRLVDKQLQIKKEVAYNGKVAPVSPAQ